MSGVFKVGRAAVFVLAVCFVTLCIGLLHGISASGEKEGTELPIVMYHSVVKDSSREGDYVVTVDRLEEDIKYILDCGYTPVFMSEVIDYVENNGSLPEKPVVITFDDGCYNNFYYVLPLLEKYKVKAVFSVVGEWCMAAGEEAQPDPNYSSMDLENLKSMVYSGWCEVANHTWDMHSLEGRKGVTKMDGESDRDHRIALYNDLTQAQRFLERSGMRPQVLTYPYGLLDEHSETAAEQLGFKATLGCGEKVNTIAVGDYSCLKNMGRFNRAACEDRKEFFKKLGIKP
ncbi:MAG: polysaccharide deacetylase family protein [Oscillospiraceae bacterium]